MIKTKQNFFFFLKSYFLRICIKQHDEADFQKVQLNKSSEKEAQKDFFKSLLASFTFFRACHFDNMTTGNTVFLGCLWQDVGRK